MHQRRLSAVGRASDGREVAVPVRRVAAQHRVWAVLQESAVEPFAACEDREGDGEIEIRA